MKKLIYLASICLSMAVTSCDDFLTVSSPDEVTTGNFWKSESEIQATMASVYAQLYHGDAWATSEVRYPVEEYRSDLFYPGEDAINYQNWTDIYKFTYTNGNTQFSYYYQDLYRGINFANQILEYAPQVPEGNISEEKRAELIAEAHFMRGYYHFMLLMNWEKIIIRDKYLSDQADLNKPLSERVKCWEFVIDELQKGTTLPATRINTEIGRATKGTAYSYLGFAYLTRAYEEPSSKDTYLAESLKALNEVKGYELVSGDDLVNMFNGHNKNCKESIFEIQYSSSTENGARYYSQMHYFILSNRTGGWDEILPETTLVDEFKKEGKTSLSGMYDERLYNTLFFKDEFWNDGTGKIYGSDYADLHWRWLTNDKGEYIDANGNVIQKEDLEEKGVKDFYDRPSFRKIAPYDTEDLNNDLYGANVLLMRYVNVLLMKAEVLNEQGHPEQAIPIINEVREKHGNMPAMTGTSQEEVRAQIEHERIIEFPLEGYRFYDLRRWGKLEQALQGRGFVKGKHEFYPIPLWEVNANASLNAEEEVTE